MNKTESSGINRYSGVFAYQVIDSLYGSILNGGILMISSIETDSLAHDIISGMLKNERNSKTEPTYKIVQKLETTLANPVEQVDSIDKYDFKILSEDQFSKLGFQRDQLFGSISLTQTVYLENDNIGCFYLAVYCGNQCSNGYLVFLNKESQEWSVKDIYRVWSS